ncbi:putative undecaprenyl pyrophosphate protein [Coniochaeta sp. 2T2.1]|nr:putative undecaprenyl pyrophosphate protein [Coniochaeta sp. 2T2.1]
MPLTHKDAEVYRRDEKFGHKLLKPEERIRLIEPYLPTPKKKLAAKAEKKSRFGVRKLLRNQLHLLVYTIIHTVFSVYIKFRQAYHAVRDRIYSVLYYHHRTPALIERDVKGLSRLPKHLSVILSLEDDGRGGAELERLVNEASEIAAWCASAGISRLSIYEKTGILKGYIPETHRAMSQKLAAYFGPSYPALSVSAPHTPSVETPGRLRPAHTSSSEGIATEPEQRHLSVMLLSYEDGRDSMVDLTKTLAEMAQRNKISPSDITIDLVDAELAESVMTPDPELLILFSPSVDLQGYPPWQVRLTEIFHVPDSQGVGYQVFYRALCNFAKAQMRHASTTLNRALFAKTVNLAAARVSKPQDIGRYRKIFESSKDILDVPRVSPIIPDPDQTLASQGRRCLLLRPGIKPDAQETWAPAVKEGVQKEDLSIIPYELNLDYNYWSYHDIMSRILPSEFHDDIPSGFNSVGHVAHLNLRSRFEPYKRVIAEVIVDKNPLIRTVINKVDNVGTESAYRTFQYEVLAGEDDMDVQVMESGCVFSFNYAKVYWNSRLEGEHSRLVRQFQPGEVVCDVMAGIGPFAVPAGKKGVFVWANDMNPESYKCLLTAIEKNKVSQFVHPFNEDGRLFIRRAADLVLAASQNNEGATIPPKRPSRSNKALPVAAEPTFVPLPPTISHFVMNLPASAITFLDCFRGLYAGHEDLFAGGERKLPLVHVHCFALKSDDEVPLLDIAERVSKELGVTMRPGDAEREGEVGIHDVRDVAPAKRMFCATFRLPAEVAFAPRPV